MPALTKAKKLKTKLKTKFKLNRIKRKNSGPARKRADAVAGPGADAVARSLRKRPENMTAGEISDAIAQVEKGIEKGKVLLPSNASLMQRALYTLKKALLDLGGVDADIKVKDKENLEKLIAEKSGGPAPTPSTKSGLAQASADVNAARQKVKKNEGAGGEADDDAGKAVALLKKKKPEDLSADEISDAIIEVEQKIEQGKTLLPADASLMQRVLTSLKLALLNLGGVDPQIDVKDEKKLRELIAKKSGKTPTDAAAKQNLTKAVDDVQKAENKVAESQPARKEETTAGQKAMDALKTKAPEDLDADEISAGIIEVENRIEQGKLLLPADASLLLRALYALKMALLELGGVDPKFDVKDEERLKELIAEKSDQASPGPKAKENLTKAANDVKKAEDEIENAAPPGDTRQIALGTLKRKKTEDLSADEISDGIIEVEKQIQKGGLLLPADASLLLRALYSLKLALLNLGNVDPRFDVKDEELLRKLISEKADQQGSKTDAKENLTKAVKDVQKAQEQVANRKSERDTGRNVEVEDKPALNRLREKKPEDLSVEEISDAITEVEELIEKGKLLFPADASYLQRVLYALKLALLELGHVDPAIDVKDKEKLEELLAAAAGKSSPNKDEKQRFAKAVKDVNGALARV